jgi:type IV secretory pathway TraG/TraD family ATPase VirD4
VLSIPPLNCYAIIDGGISHHLLNDVYGKEKAITLRSCFRNLVVLGGGSIDHHTASDLSTALGEHEVIRVDKSNTYSSVNKKDLVYKEKIVLPSEIQALPQLEGYLSFALNYPVARFKIDRVDYPVRIDSFVEKV